MNVNLPIVAPAPIANLRPYQAYYQDASKDPYLNKYGEVYSNFIAEPIIAPDTVRNRLVSASADGIPLGQVLLVRPLNAPAEEPGSVRAYHRLTRYIPNLTQRTTFDDQLFAFMGDVTRDNQAPSSVLFDGTSYQLTPPTQVPTPAYLDQLLAADPALAMVGPFAAGTADTEEVITRHALYVPNKYFAMLMGPGMTPREAWNRIRGAIVTDNQEVACDELIDWLRASLTRSAMGVASHLVRAPPQTPALATEEESELFSQFRMRIVLQDHPNLRSGHVQQGFQQVAQGITNMVDLQRQAHHDDEARRTREKTKTPVDLFTSDIHRLMRWCQVVSEAEFLPLYSKAANTKKGRLRQLLQSEIRSSMEELGYPHDLQISSRLANRVFDLEWASPLMDDFTLGLNVFTLGWYRKETVEEQKVANARADILYSGEAAPSLTDTSSVINGDQDIALPRDFTQLRFSAQQCHAFWHVVLGPHHPATTRHRLYCQRFESMEADLQYVKPRNPAHLLIVPALLARRLQVDVNVWLQEQGRSDPQIPYPDLSDVFMEIKRERDWAPSFPEAYVTRQVPITHDNSTGPLGGMSIGTGATPSTAASTITTGTVFTPVGANGPTASTATGATQTTVRNPTPEAALLPFKQLGLLSRAVRDHCRSLNIALPQNGNGQTICLAYHIKAMCNTRCGHAADHRQHTPAETQTLVTWCGTNYKVE